MGPLDKLTGTMRPDSGVTPRSAEHLRAVLLEFDAAGWPAVVREGAPEGADLVAEWQLCEPAERTVSVRTQVSRTMRIRMRLVPARHEVRVVEQQSEVKRVGGTQVSARYTRGPARTTSSHWRVGRGADGRLKATQTFRFDNSELRDPLRSAVLQAGWTWRGVVFGRL